MKLQILVPQWNEDETVIKNLLNSIETQQGIDLNEIGVIIVNDGSDTIIPDEFFTRYSFKIDYYLAPHGGVSSTRNKCLAAATADYVMFCDADDMFYSNLGIYIIFDAMKDKGFDCLISTFSEELFIDNKFTYVNHKLDDATFVHGKVYRREYLLEKQIFWNEKLLVHEDSYFNYLCRACTEPSRIVYSNNVFYLWKYRPQSVCRNDPQYCLKTFPSLTTSIDELAKELLRRGKMKEAAIVCISYIYNTYFDFNKDEWNDPENQDYIDAFYKKFADFYVVYKSMADVLSKEDLNKIYVEIKKSRTDKGMIFERITYRDWDKKLIKLAKTKEDS